MAAILITGANGFVGSYITAYLLKQGHDVTCCVRDTAATQRRFPKASVLSCDLNKDTAKEAWIPRLNGMHVVINCAGVLTGSSKQSIENIHYRAPLALFQACEQSEVRRVIQISALGITSQTQLDYSVTKLQADEALAALDVSSVIVRPSLIYAPGAYGGTALMRGLAVLPWRIPVIGEGHSRFQPIHIEDVCRSIDYLIGHAEMTGVFNLVGPEPVAYNTILSSLRRWLGLKEVKFLHLPIKLMRVVCRIGDTLKLGPISTTSLEMTLQENIAEKNAIQDIIKPQKFDEGLNSTPSQTQDRWHAKLYFIRPLIQFSLALLWFFSGIMPLMFSFAHSVDLLLSTGFSLGLAKTATIVFSIWDLLIALGLMISYKPKLIAKVQLVTIILYTVVATILMPNLWLDPFGPILKNIPILVLILVWLAVEDSR